MKQDKKRASVGGGDALFLLGVVTTSYGMTLVPNRYLQYAWLCVLVLTTMIQTGAVLYRIVRAGGGQGNPPGT